ncbi:AbrB family transcriptional regulator [Bordetella genomosp. 13]|uniref:AbrB family transcriptional regulator n=1 Tax=Bordetella genomosp. 13 TaxID=463040 RepID=UPI0011A0C01B|nr:AbrB family transcriptional regulator [Bordetella genomosp. 13]
MPEPLLARHGRPMQWAALFGISLPFILVFEAIGLPAAVLLGAIGGAIVAAVNGVKVQTPRWSFIASQGLIGCLIARSMQPDILTALLADWAICLAAVVCVILASGALGWTLARRGVLPGSTAVWGLSPGAANAMVLMAESYDADVRLVAFMQYLRVVLVVLVAAAVSRIWGLPTGAHAAPVDWFPAMQAGPFAATLAVAIGGAWLARMLRLPAGSLLLPMFVGVALQNTGHLDITLPPWLMVLCYAAIGWNIGLRFDRAVLVHALRALPRVLLSVLALMALCGLLAVLLTEFGGVDPLTAYLATSPGGADSVAIIAASSPVDLPFVMALQTARFVMVMLLGPWLAKWVAHHARGGALR